MGMEASNPAGKNSEPNSQREKRAQPLDGRQKEIKKTDIKALVKSDRL